MADPEGKPTKRGLAGWAWYGATYWLRRPAQELRGSASGVKEEWRRFRDNRAEREEAAKKRGEEYERRTRGQSPSERFAAEAARAGWTAAGLKQQERAARLARRSCLAVSGFGFLGFLVFMFLAPPMLVIVFGILAMALLACCFALAVRNAWWEFELQGRVLIPLSQFMARPDLFRRLFS